MKRSFLLCLAFVAILSGVAVAQDGGNTVSAVGSNLLRAGTGSTDDQIGGILPKRYLEEIANARIFFNSFTLGLRYEMDDPSEVGQSFQGLRRRWIDYNHDDLDLTAGSTPALFGRGLSVNAFESRPLNYDSWLDGISGSYQHSWTKEESDLRPSMAVRMVAGTLEFHNVVDTTLPVQNVSARAVNGEFGLFGKKLNVGMSFLQAFTNVNETGFLGNVTTSRETNQPEAYIDFTSGDIQGYFQYADSRSNLTTVRSNPDSVSHHGYAYYGSLSYAGSDFGLTMEYKNYAYYIHRPGEADETYLSKLPISSPPEVYKEFTYTSITRTTHNVDFDDELGFQIEANTTVIPDYVITAYAAASSRHNSYGGATDSLGIPTWNGSTSFLPKFSGTGFFPFWETFAEVEHDFGYLNYVKFFFHRRSDVIDFSGLDGTIKRSTTIGGKCQYHTSASESILASFEHQWMYDTQSLNVGHNVLNELLTLQYSFGSAFTFGGVYDFSTEYDATRHIWPQGFISFRVGGSHTILMSYGAERGGLNCTGGICRVVPAFNGLRVTVTSQF